MSEQGKDSSPGAVVETACGELTIPQPLSPRAAGGEEVEPKKQGEVRSRCFKNLFYFSLTCSDFD